jgi:hypothetical protein
MSDENLGSEHLALELLRTLIPPSSGQEYHTAVRLIKRALLDVDLYRRYSGETVQRMEALSEAERKMEHHNTFSFETLRASMVEKGL